MKKLKRIALVLVIGLFATQSYAQYSFGGGLSYMSFFQGDGYKTLGLNVQGHYVVSEKVLGSLTLGYYFPQSTETSVYGYAYSSSTTPYEISIPATFKTSVINIVVDGKYYLIGETEEDFGLYGLAGLSLMIAPQNIQFGNYDSSNYYSTSEEGTDLLGNFMMHVGVGGEYKLGFGYLFIDARVAFPATQVNGQSVDVQIGPNMQINGGVRIPLD